METDEDGGKRSSCRREWSVASPDLFGDSFVISCSIHSKGLDDILKVFRTASSRGWL